MEPNQPAQIGGEVDSVTDEIVQRSNRRNVLNRWLETACNCTGSKSTEFADRILMLVASGLTWPRPKDDYREQIVKAQSAISEMEPRKLRKRC